MDLWLFWPALRGAATLKQRVQREARSNASVLPYEKGSEKGHSWSTDIWCKEGELLKRTRKGRMKNGGLVRTFCYEKSKSGIMTTCIHAYAWSRKLRYRVSFLMQGIYTRQEYLSTSTRGHRLEEFYSVRKC